MSVSFDFSWGGYSDSLAHQKNSVDYIQSILKTTANVEPGKIVIHATGFHSSRDVDYGQSFSTSDNHMVKRYVHRIRKIKLISPQNNSVPMYVINCSNSKESLGIYDDVFLVQLALTDHIVDNHLDYRDTNRSRAFVNKTKKHNRFYGIRVPVYENTYVVTKQTDQYYRQKTPITNSYAALFAHYTTSDTSPIVELQHRAGSTGLMVYGNSYSKDDDHHYCFVFPGDILDTLSKIDSFDQDSYSFRNSSRSAMEFMRRNRYTKEQYIRDSASQYGWGYYDGRRKYQKNSVDVTFERLRIQNFTKVGISKDSSLFKYFLEQYRQYRNDRVYDPTNTRIDIDQSTPYVWYTGGRSDVARIYDPRLDSTFNNVPVYLLIRHKDGLQTSMSMVQFAITQNIENGKIVHKEYEVDRDSLIPLTSTDSRLYLFRVPQLSLKTGELIYSPEQESMLEKGEALFPLTGFNLLMFIREAGLAVSNEVYLHKVGQNTRTQTIFGTTYGDADMRHQTMRIERNLSDFLKSTDAEAKRMINYQIGSAYCRLYSREKKRIDRTMIIPDRWKRQCTVPVLESKYSRASKIRFAVIGKYTKYKVNLSNSNRNKSIGGAFYHSSENYITYMPVRVRRIYHRDIGHWLNEQPYYIGEARDGRQWVFSYHLDTVRIDNMQNNDSFKSILISNPLDDPDTSYVNWGCVGSILTVSGSDESSVRIRPAQLQTDYDDHSSVSILEGNFISDMFEEIQQTSDTGVRLGEWFNVRSIGNTYCSYSLDYNGLSVISGLFIADEPASIPYFGRYIHYPIRHSGDASNYSVQNQCGFTFSFGISDKLEHVYIHSSPTGDDSTNIIVSSEGQFKPYYQSLTSGNTAITVSTDIINSGDLERIEFIGPASRYADYKFEPTRFACMSWRNYPGILPPALGYNNEVIYHQQFSKVPYFLRDPFGNMELLSIALFVKNNPSLSNLLSHVSVVEPSTRVTSSSRQMTIPRVVQHSRTAGMLRDMLPLYSAKFRTKYGDFRYLIGLEYDNDRQYTIGFLTRKIEYRGYNRNCSYLDDRFIQTMPAGNFWYEKNLTGNDTYIMPWCTMRGRLNDLSGDNEVYGKQIYHVVGYYGSYLPINVNRDGNVDFNEFREADGVTRSPTSRHYLALSRYQRGRSDEGVIISDRPNVTGYLPGVFKKYNKSDLGVENRAFNLIYPPFAGKNIVRSAMIDGVKQYFYPFSIADYGQSDADPHLGNREVFRRVFSDNSSRSYIHHYCWSNQYYQDNRQASGFIGFPIQMQINEISYITALGRDNNAHDYAREVKFHDRDYDESGCYYMIAKFEIKPNPQNQSYDIRAHREFVDKPRSICTLFSLTETVLYTLLMYRTKQVTLPDGTVHHPGYYPIHVKKKFVENDSNWDGSESIEHFSTSQYPKNCGYATFLTQSELERVIRNLSIGHSVWVELGTTRSYFWADTATKFEVSNNIQFINTSTGNYDSFRLGLPITGTYTVDLIATPHTNYTFRTLSTNTSNYSLETVSRNLHLFRITDNVGTDLIYTELPNGKMGWSYPFLKKLDVSGPYSEYTTKFISETPDVNDIANLPVILKRMNKLFHSLPNKVNSSSPVINRKRYFSPISMRHHALKYRMMHDFDINNLTLDGTYRLRYPIKLNPNQDAEFAMIPYSNPSMYEAGRDSNTDALTYYETMSNHSRTVGRDVVMIPDDRFPYCDQILFRDVSENNYNGPHVRLGDLYNEMMFTQISQSVQASGRRYATYFDFAANLIGTTASTKSIVSAIDFFVPNWNTRESLVDPRVFSPLRTFFLPTSNGKVYAAIGDTSVPKQHRSPESYMLSQFHYPGITGDVARENSRYTVPVMVKPGDGLQFRKVNLEVRNNEADVRAATGDQCWIVNQSQMKEIVDMNISKKYLTDSGVPRLFNSPTDKLAAIPFGTLHGKYFKINMKPGEYICPAINGGNALASVINISTSGYYELWFGEGDYIITNLAMLDDRKFNFVTFDPNVTNSIVTCIIHPNARFIVEGNLAVSNQDVQYMVQTPSDKIETNQAWLVPYGPFSLKNNFFIRSPDNQSLVQFEPRHHSQVTEDFPYKWKTNGLNLWVDDFLIPE